MDSSTFFKHWIASETFDVIAQQIKQKKNLRLKGLVGSADTLLSASVLEKIGGIHVHVLHDLEEAKYFYADLLNFVPAEKVGFYPSSYKKPYHFDEILNANVLQRTEVLQQLRKGEDYIIITFAEALTEKVVNKRQLKAKSIEMAIGDELELDAFSEQLFSCDFELRDFVSEPGTFAVRGGIIDIFSYGHTIPYRVELNGDIVESIREFDAENQLSIKACGSLTIVNNLSIPFEGEKRESFFEYVDSKSYLWLKDYEQMLDIVDKSIQKAEEKYLEIDEQNRSSTLFTQTRELFVDKEEVKKQIEEFTTVEYGKRFYLPHNVEIQFSQKPQPSFNKNTQLMVEYLENCKEKGYRCYLIADSASGLSRLNTIFQEISPSLEYDELVMPFHQGFVDDDNERVCFTEHQLFNRHYQSEKGKKKSTKSLVLKELNTLQSGDYIVHSDYGIGRFSGLDLIDVGENKQEALRIIYRDNDLLYVSLQSLHKISKYANKEATPPSISKLGSTDWETKKKRVKKKLKDIAKDLISLYAKRKTSAGFAYPQDDYLQSELESSFIYEDTHDQKTATQEVKEDMEKNFPMDRLVCGDVGFGKTEIAIRAAFKAVTASKQVVVLVPTTILASQHYRTFTERLEKFPVTIEYVNRFKSAKEISQIKKSLKDSKIDILIGTHKVINKEFEFQNLGLIIIDEEQKFGVKVKEQLKQKRVHVDSLTLTATPIPRTLHFSLMGARDLSVISTPPPNRRPVTTELHVMSYEVIRDAISHELRRNGQVFFVHNRVKDIEEIGNLILKLIPDARIAVAHGQMSGDKLEKTMLKFINKQYDVLISTNIIESGLDIPNANTIIINNSHMYGLSDLHQMRGRVGRSNIKAYCYFITPPISSLSSDARKRLQTLEEFSNLGDGLNVAMRDLDIRGAGNLLGGEQSGFINDIGFEMYHKILDEAVQEIKENEFKDLFESQLSINVQKTQEECIVETDIESLIPETYIKNITERLAIYTELDKINENQSLDDFVETLRDRFGATPTEVVNLTNIIRLRIICVSIGFVKVVIKNNKMRLYLPSEDTYIQSQTFGVLLEFIKQEKYKISMKEVSRQLLLSVNDIESVTQALEVVGEIKKEVNKK